MNAELAAQCQVSIENSRSPGGQHVGTDRGIMVVKHPETGIEIRLPPISTSSQHKRRMACIDAIEFLIAST